MRIQWSGFICGFIQKKTAVIKDGFYVHEKTAFLMADEDT